MTTTPLPRADTSAADVQAKPRPLWAIRAYQTLAGLFWIGVMVQAFFAGAGIFAGGAWMRAHEGLGHCLSSPIPMIPLLLLILTFVARLPRTDKAVAAWLLLFAMIQPYFVYMRGINPLIGAFHPVNAMALVVLPLYMLMRSRHIAPSAKG